MNTKNFAMYGVFAALTAVAPSALANTTYASLIAVNTDGNVYVEELDTTVGSSSVLGPTTVSPGGVTTLVADMNNDGMSDVVCWNDSSVYVYFGQVSSSGSALFGAANELSSGSFYGTKANLIGDVNGDGYPDLVAWNPSTVYVELGNGTSDFGSPVEWSTDTFYGSVANTVNDINGDGYADLVAWNGSTTYVETSTGCAPVFPFTTCNGFNTSAQWLNQSFSGTEANLEPRYVPSCYDNTNNAEGLLAWNSSSVYTTDANSSNSGFVTPQELSSGAFYGTQANIVLDVNQDRIADLVAVNDSTVYVELGQCSDGNFSMSGSTEWVTDQAFYGSVGTFGGLTVR